jgi:hypothetical protein
MYNSVFVKMASSLDLVELKVDPLIFEAVFSSQGLGKLNPLLDKGLAFRFFLPYFFPGVKFSQTPSKSIWSRCRK